MAESERLISQFWQQHQESFGRKRILWLKWRRSHEALTSNTRAISIQNPKALISPQACRDHRGLESGNVFTSVSSGELLLFPLSLSLLSSNSSDDVELEITPTEVSTPLRLRRRYDNSRHLNWTLWMHFIRTVF